MIGEVWLAALKIPFNIVWPCNWYLSHLLFCYCDVLKYIKRVGSVFPAWDAMLFGHSNQRWMSSANFSFLYKVLGHRYFVITTQRALWWGNRRPGSWCWSHDLKQTLYHNLSFLTYMFHVLNETCSCYNVLSRGLFLEVVAITQFLKCSPCMHGVLGSAPSKVLLEVLRLCCVIKLFLGWCNTHVYSP